MDRNQEYNMLVSLRKAIIGKQSAQKQLNELKSRKQMKFQKQEPALRYSDVKDNTKALEAEYSRPYKNAIARREDVATFFWSLCKLIFMFAVLLAALIGTGFLAYIVAKWSWNSSVGHMTGMTYLSDTLTYDLAVGIHLFALSIFLFLASGIMLAFLGSADDVVAVFLGIIGFTFLILGGVSFFASFPYYYSTASGFWETVFTFFGSFLAIPLMLRSFGFIFCLGAVVAAGIGLIVLAGFICTRIEFHRVYLSKNIDMTELKNSAKYKEAKKKDEAETRKRHEEEKQKYERDLIQYKQDKKDFEIQKEACDAVVRKANNQYLEIIRKCDSVINGTALHPSYKNIRSLNIILYYFDYNRADSIKEAINLYIQDQRFLAFLEKMDSIDSRLNSIATSLNSLAESERAQVKLLSEGIRSIENKMDRMENSITQTVQSVGTTLNSALRQINDDNNKNAKRQEDLSKRILNANQEQLAVDNRIANMLLNRFTSGR